MKYNKPIKLYLFKDKNIKLCLRVSDNMVHHFNWDIELFEDMLLNWRTHWAKDRWDIMWKTRGPRPERAPASYVSMSFYQTGQGLHFRFDYDDFVALEKDYYYQKHNKMHWDNDV